MIIQSPKEICMPLTVNIRVACRQRCSVLMLTTAVSCLPLLTQIASTAETAVGTVLNVSCTADKQMVGVDLPMTSVCDELGRWQPSIPDCIGEFETEARCFVRVRALERVKKPRTPLEHRIFMP